MDQYLSEIRLFSFGFAPKGWAKCDGQLLQISQNQALYSLLGTTYGGNGMTTFALPDLRGRAPIHFAPDHPLGFGGGEEKHTLSVGEIPQHNHVLQASTQNADQPVPSILAASNNVYGPPDAAQTQIGVVPPYGPSISGPVGGNNVAGAHENMMPFQVINYCIALQGLFPPRN